MSATVEIDESLKQELDDRARNAGTSTSELVAALIREGLERLPDERPSDGTPPNGRRQSNAGGSIQVLLASGLPQLYLQPGTDISLDTITDILDAVEADERLGPPLRIDEATRAELNTYAREHDIPVGKLAARLLQQSLLQRKEWPSWHGIPQVPSTSKEPITFEFIKQLQEELDLEDFLD